MFDMVNLEKGKLPEDYHCNCKFCRKYKGMLIKPDGTKYSKLERNKYYDPSEKGHIAKTPLHIARWAVQQFTKEKDWVLDPTIGAGTTAVEAVIQRRNACGIEIQFAKIAAASVKKNIPSGIKSRIIDGDARDLKKYFKRSFDLIVNNPPYSGDENQKGFKGKRAEYDKTITQNLGLLKESSEYWNTIQQIYEACIERTRGGGHFVLGVKDMVKNKQPFLLHKMYGEILACVGYFYKYMVLLPHWPPTLFMSTYNKRFPDVKVPRYQTVMVFQKRG